MFAAIVYMSLVVLGFSINLYKLEANHWKPVYGARDKYPIFSWFCTVVISALLYWWVIASIGWVPATMVMVVWATFSLLSLLWDAIIHEGQGRVTLPTFLAFSPISIAIGIALILAA